MVFVDSQWCHKDWHCLGLWCLRGFFQLQDWRFGQSGSRVRPSKLPQIFRETQRLFTWKGAKSAVSFREGIYILHIYIRLHVLSVGGCCFCTRFDYIFCWCDLKKQMFKRVCAAWMKFANWNSTLLWFNLENAATDADLAFVIEDYQITVLGTVPSLLRATYPGGMDTPWILEWIQKN